MLGLGEPSSKLSWYHHDPWQHAQVQSIAKLVLFEMQLDLRWDSVPLQRLIESESRC